MHCLENVFSSKSPCLRSIEYPPQHPAYDPTPVTLFESQIEYPQGVVQCLRDRIRARLADWMLITVHRAIPLWMVLDSIRGVDMRFLQLEGLR